jgi:hypothetical protein
MTAVGIKWCDATTAKRERERERERKERRIEGKECTVSEHPVSHGIEYVPFIAESRASD